MTPSEDASAGDPWRRDWFLVGLATHLAEDGQHVTVDLPDLSVTIQNFRGRLAGFWNVCSHRAAKIRYCGRGQGLLRCAYHGWTYNGAGVPVGIPDNEELFGLSREEKQKLALRPIEVATCGGFVFARVEPSGGSLAEQLGSLAAILEGADTPADEKEAAVEQPWSAVLGSWLSEDVIAERLAFAPNAIADRSGGSVLIRSASPLAPSRASVSAFLIRGSDPASALLQRWESALAV